MPEDGSGTGSPRGAAAPLTIVKAARVKIDRNFMCSSLPDECEDTNKPESQNSRASTRPGLGTTVLRAVWSWYLCGLVLALGFCVEASGGELVVEVKLPVHFDPFDQFPQAFSKPIQFRGLG